MIWVDAKPVAGDMGSRRSGLRGLHLDGPLLIGLLLLSMISLVVLYSASGQNLDLIIRQAVRFGIAFTVLLIVAQIPPRFLEFWSPWLFGTGLVLLLAVLWFGESGKGAQRWLDLWIIRFQPSELLKIAVPMMIAWYLSEARLPPSWIRLLISTVLIILPAVLVAMQPDLGTALLIASAGFFVLLLAGLRWRVVAGLSLLLVALTPLLWYVMHDYQRNRVLTFLNPENDPLGAGYHIIQSKIALGSGGIYGKGWLNGTQSRLEFLPERSTDFIFAVFGEEFGLIGILILLALYLFIVIRGLYISMQAQSTYGRLLGGCLILTFLVHVFINIGMVTGLLPIVGLPLPLISYGGSYLVTLLAAFGILMSIHTHRKLLSP